MKKSLLSIYCLLILVANSSFSQSNKVVQTWAQRFNGIDSLTDRGFAIDINDNIYVTGSSTNNGGSDFTTLKYSPNGQLLWSQTFTGGAIGTGIARAVVVDNACNAYVTGTSVYRQR